MNPALVEAARRLRDAESVSVLTGAGLSQASGVPTFRGHDGYWNNHRPEDLATPAAFGKDPGLVWRWYQSRRETVARCRPNRGHTVLASWQHRFERFHLVTQNVDGLDEAAGSEAVIHFHGSLWQVRCATPCPDGQVAWTDRSVDLGRVPPPCPHCGGLLRPAVVWFGEVIAEDVIERALDAARADVFLVIGTSAVVHPAAGIVGVAADHGASLIEINPEDTPVSNIVTLTIRGPAAESLDQIDRALGQSAKRTGA